MRARLALRALRASLFPTRGRLRFFVDAKLFLDLRLLDFDLLLDFWDLRFLRCIRSGVCPLSFIAFILRRRALLARALFDADREAGILILL